MPDYEVQTPINVIVLLLPGASLLTVASTIDPLRAANRVAGRVLFDWRIVSVDGKAVATSGGIAIPVSGTFDADQVSDWLAIIAGFHARDLKSRPLTGRIFRAARKAKQVFGIESGAWLLARAGLLDSKAAATHWEDWEDFSAAFPAVDLRRENVAQAQTIITIAGAEPAFEVICGQIADLHGATLASEVRRVFLKQAAVTTAQPEIGGKLADAIAHMERHVDRPQTTGAIARRVGMTARGLELLFRREMGVTPGAHFLAMRLAEARRLVRDTRAPMAEIAGRCGFSSVAVFSRAFSRAYSMPPSRFRKGG